MRIYETELTDRVLETLIAMSVEWEAEMSTFGYRANERNDIEGNRIFLVGGENGEVIGYLFGAPFESKNMKAVMPEGTRCFEVEELYVVPHHRSEGIGKALFSFAEKAVRDTADYMVLSTATKNWRAILHFYLEELDMEFWNARLFKRITDT